MSYLESIFQRLEQEFVSPSKQQIQDWLAGVGTKHEKKRSSFSNFATILQEPFAVREQVDSVDETDWTTADDLRDLKIDAQSLDTELGRVDTINEIQRKLNTVESLETEQIDLREQLIAERESLKQELSEAITPEEVKIAKRELGELSPQSLGGIKSGATRRVPKAFSTLFE